MNNGYRAVLDSIASSSPTPGGGAVAALSIAHGVALSRMVCELTIGREKWKEGHQSAENFLSTSQTWLTKSVELAQQDCDAFDSVMAAYKLSKGDDRINLERKSTINSANLAAATSPLNIAEFGQTILQMLPEIATHCNGNAITDMGSASHLIFSGIQCASLNVRINLSSLGDEKKSYETTLENIMREVDSLHGEVCNIVNHRMSN